MEVYMISYDLGYPEYNQDKVKFEIEALGNWTHYLDITTYLVNTEMNNVEIEKLVNRHLTKVDRLTVCKISNPNKWLGNKNLKWMRRVEINDKRD